MSVKGKLIIEIMPDGSIKTNAQSMQGSEEEVLQELEALAQQLGGDLEVEKHVEGAHHHHHHHGKGHAHTH